MSARHDADHMGDQAPLRIVLIYALFAALWILLSDRAVEAIFREPELIVRASMIKGWLFVAVTSALLYVLVRRMHDRLLAAAQRERDTQSEKLRALQLIETIAETSEDAIFAKDVQGRYLLFNRAASGFVGRPAQAVIGRDDRALFPPEQAALLMAFDRLIIDQGCALTREEHLATAHGARDFLTTKGPLRDAEGRIIGVYGVSRDVTESRRAQAEIRERNEDLAATLQAIPDLLLELDEDGHHLKVHTTADALLAAPAEQLIGRTVGEILPAQAAQAVMDALAHAGRAGCDYGRTIAVPFAGEVHYFELSVARKGAPDGQRRRFVVLAREVTARKRAEDELRRRNEELERFDRAAVGREMQMIELKRTVNALARELGRQAPFDLSFADEPAGGDTP